MDDGVGGGRTDKANIERNVSCKQMHMHMVAFVYFVT